MVEVPVRSDEKNSLTSDTTDAEMTRIATRLEEAAAVAAAGEFGFTVEDADAAEAENRAEREEFTGKKELARQEELASKEDLAGRDAEPSEPAEDASGSLEINSSSSSSSGSSLQAEPPSPPRRRLRKAVDVAGRQTGQQPRDTLYRGKHCCHGSASRRCGNWGGVFPVHRYCSCQADKGTYSSASSYRRRAGL